MKEDICLQPRQGCLQGKRVYLQTCSHGQEHSLPTGVCKQHFYYQTRTLGPLRAHPHRCAVYTQPLCFAQSDPCWGLWPAAPLTEGSRRKKLGSGRGESARPACPATPRRVMPGNQRAFACVSELAWLRVGLGGGATVPSPPPPPSPELLEQSPLPPHH